MVSVTLPLNFSEACGGDAPGRQFILEPKLACVDQGLIEKLDEWYEVFEQSD